MKKRFSIISFMFILLIVISFSCKENDPVVEQIEKSNEVSIKSVLAYAENLERGYDTLDVSFNPRLDTLILTTPQLYTEDSPVDITKVILEVEVAKGASCNVSEEYYDMTRDDHKITIIAEDGTKRELALKIIVTSHEERIPELHATITEVWTKTNSELGLRFPKNLRAMTIYKDYILILDNFLDYNENAKIKAYNKFTGEFVQNVKYYYGGWPSTESYMFGLDADDAGNFAVSRYNYGGAGFRLDVYSSLDAVPLTPILCTTSEVPLYAGRKISITGDLMNGEAYITATTYDVFGHSNNTYNSYCTWKIDKGQPVNRIPSVNTYSGDWHSSYIQRASVEDPTLYISYNDEPNFPNDPWDSWEKIYGGHFTVYNPESGQPPLEINQKNFGYRILEHKVINLGEHKLLFTLEQGYALAGSKMNTTIYNITDKKRYNLQPGMDGHEKLKIYKSSETIVDNSWRLGNVAGWVDEDTKTAYLYAIYPGDDNNEAKLTLVKITLNE